MYLTHNGVVRATPKAEVRGVETDGVAPGHKVDGMVFGFDAQKVQAAIERRVRCRVSAMCVCGWQAASLP